MRINNATNPWDYLITWAKTNNTYYENIARDLNLSNSLGYTASNLDVLKHTIAAADGAINDGAAWTSTLGYGNEVYSAAKGRDGYNEHAKDLYNNYVGIAVGEWLQDNLGRAPTLDDILTVMPILVKSGVLADRGHSPKGSIGILYALEASDYGDSAGVHPIIETR